MDAERFQHWLDSYVDSWKTYDEEAIRALFSDDAQYRYHPWDEDAEVVVGPDAIVASWLDEPDEPGSWSAEYHPFAVDGDRAVAVGVTRYVGVDHTGVDREYHNVFLCLFDDAGRCREFTELYLIRPRANPS